LFINSLALSDNFNTFLSELVNLIKTNQSDQSDLFYKSDFEYHNDYTSAPSINISITEKVFKETRTFTSVSMIINLSQEQVQIINNIVQITVTAALKRFNLQAESFDSSEF